MEERFYWLGFSAAAGIGPKRFSQLLAHFSSAERAWNASESDKQQALGKKIGEQLSRFSKDFSLEAYIEKLQKKNIWFVIVTDKNYPKLLKQTDNPPFVLYVRGEIDFNILRTIGIVGTRKITSYGREVTEMLTRDLVASGFCIVSGLALGVDAIAHQATIENNGKTIAVLGCGVDVCYPSSNQKIYDAIVQGSGAVVSEYPLGATPSIGSFPSRNRIIAGLSEAVIVTEGAADSGALITAEDAIKNKRPVFAVPGQITSHLAKGPLSLIQKGAKIVTSAEDVLRELRTTNYELRKENKKIKGDTKEEQQIIDLLKIEALSSDGVARATGLSTQQLGSIISLMEIKGIVKIDTTGMISLSL